MMLKSGLSGVMLGHGQITRKKAPGHRQGQGPPILPIAFKTPETERDSQQLQMRTSYHLLQFYLYTCFIHKVLHIRIKAN